MHLFEALEWSNWKNLSIEVKNQVINQVLMYFVSPLKRISDVEYKEFELAGVKCGTFECSIDGERFVLVPGSKEVILGWDLGTQGLPVTVWDKKAIHVDTHFETIVANYGLENGEDWDIFVNESTSALRKVSIPPMLIQKEALPAGTKFIGQLDTITGEFQGLVEQFAPIEENLRQHFKQPTNFEESLMWQLPTQIFEKDSFYALLHPADETYRIYCHQTCTLNTLRRYLHQQMFDLLDEDQWEYAVGAGTRKLFRWGTELDEEINYYGKQVTKKMHQENMFGLLFDVQHTRWEITDSNRLKLEKQADVGIPLFDKLPLSSYYRSRKILAEEEILDPCDFLYRKVIVIAHQ